MNAKLKTIQAQRALDGPQGAIWTTGLHHVYVDDHPARVFVPQHTIYDTFEDLRHTLEREGSVGFGVDHLPPELFEDNQILKKMDLHNVGRFGKVAFDGDSIHILESELTNPVIQDLHERGELPAYSIVGAMEASPCPDERADYVVDRVRIERVDFVEEGGCVECKTTSLPGEILITSKKSKHELEDEIMEVEQKEIVDSEEATEPVDEQVESSEPEHVPEEEVKEEAPAVETEPQDEDDDKPVADEPPAPEEEEDAMSIIKQLAEELKELKQQLGGKKPRPVKAKHSEGHDTIELLIKAGKATPAQKESLQRLHDADPEAFNEYAETLKPILDMETRAKNPNPESKPKGEDEEITAEKILEIMRNR